jgi:hypothetical protein
MAENANGRDDLERYKQAASDACNSSTTASASSRANKGKVAEQIARNRAYIREHLMGENPEPDD